MLSVKHRDIKYHFLSLWYDSTRDWTQVSRAIGEHANHYATEVLSDSEVTFLGKGKIEPFVHFSFGFCL